MSDPSKLKQNFADIRVSIGYGESVYVRCHFDEKCFRPVERGSPDLMFLSNTSPREMIDVLRLREEEAQAIGYVVAQRILALLSQADTKDGYTKAELQRMEAGSGGTG